MMTVNYQAQIQEIRDYDIPQILQLLPTNSYFEDKFEDTGTKWTFKFNFTSPAAKFSAVGFGTNPREAFAIARQMIYRQVREWWRVREEEDVFLPSLSEAATKVPVVFIVDDDIDMALATEAMFKQLGCRTQVMCDPSDAHRRLSFDEPDLIVLDWKLGNHLCGSEVVERANRLIDAFSDLRKRFEHNHPKVVTHSVLDRGHVQLPESGYFNHYDHWQKPMPYSELIQRGSDLLTDCGF